MNLRSALIFAKDLNRLISFYRDGMGLRLRDDTATEGFAELDAGGALLVLHAIPVHVVERIEIASPPVARENTALKLVFETHDLEAARAHLTRHGAQMHEPRASGACDGVDPEGNVFRIVRA